jgi:hypothetical protein
MHLVSLKTQMFIYVRLLVPIFNTTFCSNSLNNSGDGKALKDRLKPATSPEAQITDFTLER